MKKYITPGMIAIALVALWLSFSSGQVGTQGSGDTGLAFYGTATTGVRVRACKYPAGTPCYDDIAQFNHYQIYIPTDETGWYEIGDGCQTHYAGWYGTPQEVNFCVNYPGQPECPCY